MIDKTLREKQQNQMKCKTIDRVAKCKRFYLFIVIQDSYIIIKLGSKEAEAKLQEQFNEKR